MAKLEEADTLEAVLEQLTKGETLALLGNARAIAAILQLADKAGQSCAEPRPLS